MKQSCGSPVSSQHDPTELHRYLRWGLPIETFKISVPKLHPALLPCNAKFVSPVVAWTGSCDFHLHCRLAGGHSAPSKTAVLDWATGAMLISYSSKYNPKMTYWLGDSFSLFHSLCGSSCWMYWTLHQTRDPLLRIYNLGQVLIRRHKGHCVREGEKEFTYICIKYVYL